MIRLDYCGKRGGVWGCTVHRRLNCCGFFFLLQPEHFYSYIKLGENNFSKIMQIMKNNGMKEK